MWSGRPIGTRGRVAKSTSATVSQCMQLRPSDDVSNAVCRLKGVKYSSVAVSVFAFCRRDRASQTCIAEARWAIEQLETSWARPRQSIDTNKNLRPSKTGSGKSQTALGPQAGSRKGEVVEQLSLDPASFSPVDALQEDPFYAAISVDYENQPSLRRLCLAEYFSYSLEEARLIGRCVHLSDHSIGAAAWLLPQDEAQRRQSSSRKAKFLEDCLGPTGWRNYKAIVNWMSKQSASHIAGAWCLSIVGVAHEAQGRGLGGQLLMPTLAEADAAEAECYLETFSARNIRFYERLGFHTLRVFLEPTTKGQYSLMCRCKLGSAVREKSHA